MRRRDVIALLGTAAAWPRAAGAAAAKFARVGVIDDTALWEPFRQQLRELNYVEGKTIVFEYRRADGVPERLDQVARELARLPVDVIVTYGTPAAQAAQRATKTVPIVIIGVGDPVGAGLVTNFARPGDNITGNSILSADIVTKRLEVLKDAIPSVSRIALLWNPDNASNIAILQETQKAAPLFHMTLALLQARTPDDFDSVFAQMASDRPDALLTTNDPLHQLQMSRVIDFLLKNRIAGMFQLRQNVADGGLMAYTASVPDLFRRGAVYVDKILRGTKPGDLPIEQPLTFEFIVNLKTAKAIGVDFPQALLARADEVIE
ncbi:MAG TPA: ABC transporter substrate-binding protein [Xanthobacteraceae bacterium]|nr:ABC transporter substrate-binding protein [Xanthobacteraceae bacterium]